MFASIFIGAARTGAEEPSGGIVEDSSVKGGLVVQIGCPNGADIVGDRRIAKPIPDDIDEWTHCRINKL